MALRDLNDAWGWIQRLIRRVSRLESGAMLENSSITNGRMRFIGGLLLIDSGGKLEVVGEWQLTGTGEITGDVVATGKWTQNGAWDFNGPGDIAGNVNLTGNLSVGGGGRVTVGPMVLDRLGPAGGRLRSTGQLILGDGTGVVYVDGSTTITGPLGVEGFTNLQGLDVSGPKNFKMEHPSKPGFWLRHGATESPVSGTEYAGKSRIGADGSVIVDLPDYFEALNKPDGRTVQVTPVGAPFAVGASEVENGKFTAFGAAGRDVFWLVKAERVGGDFLLEEPIEPQ